MTLRSRPSFLFLGANTPWVYALARHLEPHSDVTAVRFIDWLNNARIKPQWPETGSKVHRVAMSMPPGYAGRLEGLARPFMRSFIERERARLRIASGSEPFVVCAYPYMAPWVRQVPDDRVVYYNLDDYSLYHAGKVDQTRRLEDEILLRAALSICLSARQVDAFRARHPQRAERIRHFPLGVQPGFINPEPSRPARGDTVGYVGNMTDRVDWRFIHQVASAMPRARFEFIGHATELPTGGNVPRDPDWQAYRTRVLQLPNVSAPGPVRQSDVHLSYWNSAVNWMPYDADHPFNIASCPTKLMDALASGRPFVSTDIPEARRYPTHVRVVRDVPEAVARIGSLLEGAEPHDPAAQVLFAKRQTWDHRADEFLQLLHG